MSTSPESCESTQRPEKTCNIDRLVRSPRLVKAALSGRKTQQRRDGVYAWAGEHFDLDGEPFEVIDLRRERLGDMDETSAGAEGFESLSAYRELIVRMHPGMEWDPEHRVWVHEFRRCGPASDAGAGRSKTT